MSLRCSSSGYEASFDSQNLIFYASDLRETMIRQTSEVQSSSSLTEYVLRVSRILSAPPFPLMTTLLVSEPVLSGSLGSLSMLLGTGFPSLNDTYGALLLGSFAGLISYGILVHQAYRYFRVYSGDKLINKAALDTLQNLVIIHACYTYLISDYFKPLALLRGIWFTVPGQTFAEYQRFYWIDSAACGAAIVSDSLTAGVLIVTLSRQRTPYEETNTLLNTLIIYTINTGAIVNALAIVFALARPNTMEWIAIELLAVRLYTNSVLAVLNSRKSLREASDRSGPMELELELELQSVPKPDTDEHHQSGSESALGETLPKSTLVGWPSGPVVEIMGVTGGQLGLQGVNLERVD
ncbi:hypothetical protein C8T65DRAFT_665701 [Cerioporus squamosus]|nr:hypothetical protein C8T65DRAFT_665701 [Cerioporus squamosus]